MDELYQSCLRELTMNYPNDLLVSVDVGCTEHSVAVGLRNGSVLEEFSIGHNKEGFDRFFSGIENHKSKVDGEVLIAMEGYNGYARPLDRFVLAKSYRLFNINNLKLARFKEVFPGAAKTDAIDARKGLELFQLQSSLPLAKEVLTEVRRAPLCHEQLKRLTRRRRRLVQERVSVMNAVHSDIQAVCPGLLELVNKVNERWFINFLSLVRKDITELAGKRRSTLQKINRVGVKRLERVVEWQTQAVFSDECDWVTPLILQDVKRIGELNSLITELDEQIVELCKQSQIARLLSSLPGFGPTSCAELAGEIGNEKRFANESAMALYLGVAPLDNSSGKSRGSKTPRQVNRRCKTAMMAATDHHRRQVPQSKEYYDRKRAEGKGHNQALRALARHLCKVIFKMFAEKREYQMR